MTVRLTRDPSGRFPERPYYQERELDQMFEESVVGFLQRRHGSARFPITTDELTVLIEEDVSDLDQYADLSRYGPDVEGLTEFNPGSKPRVAMPPHSNASCTRRAFRSKGGLGIYLRTDCATAANRSGHSR